jgi:transposase-like protein
MVQRGRKTSLEERIEIGERWEAGQTDPEIAAAMGRPVPTVRKWRRKYQREGRAPGIPYGQASHWCLGAVSA